jgi:hypothetical protein
MWKAIHPSPERVRDWFNRGYSSVTDLKAEILVPISMPVEIPGIGQRQIYKQRPV